MGAIALHTVAKTIAEVIERGLLFCSVFDPIMLCDEAPSVDILLSSIWSRYMYAVG